MRFSRVIAKRVWAKIRGDDVFGRSAQLAYYFFLALFPFLICVIASLSVFGAADRGRVLLFSLFARFLPAQASGLISGVIDDIIHSSGPLKMSFGIVVSLWSASLGMSAVMDTLNAAYNVRETRSLLSQYAVAIGLTLGLALLLVASVLLVVAGAVIAHRLSSGTAMRLAWTIVQWSMGFSLLLFANAILYYFAPNLKNKRWHWVTAGSVIGVILLMIVLLGLRIYLRFAGTYTATYGSLGAVIILLLCFYLSGVAVLSGGIVNAVLETGNEDPFEIH